jgi:elongation factor Ts
MANISVEQIKSLRDETGISVMQVKKALEQANGDVAKAKILLQKKGAEIAAKKSDRTLAAGLIASYIHSNGAFGALVELGCETDFVARNPEFKELAEDIAMQVVAQNPSFLRETDIAEEERNRVRETFASEVDSSKPEEIRTKILDGKLNSYFAEKVLLKQEFIKDPEKTIAQLLETATQKFGERTEIVRFVRFGVMEA